MSVKYRVQRRNCATSGWESELKAPRYTEAMLYAVDQSAYACETRRRVQVRLNKHDCWDTIATFEPSWKYQED